jgi:cbb3-type cytochrome c oxidase subunit III
MRACSQLIAIVLLTAAASAVNAGRVDPLQDSRPLIRGGIVYKAYCVVCHGEAGNGIARATKLYQADNLLISEAPIDSYEKIIRLGGESVGRSPYMPPWQDELSEEQLTDVLAYLTVVRKNEQRGEVVFKTNCILCHGIDGDGKGRASVLYDPKPSNLILSDKSEIYKQTIINSGGQAMGRSSIMPPWGLQLSDQEMKDVLAYLQKISAHPISSLE